MINEIREISDKSCYWLFAPLFVINFFMFIGYLSATDCYLGEQKLDDYYDDYDDYSSSNYSDEIREQNRLLEESNRLQQEQIWQTKEQNRLIQEKYYEDRRNNRW